MGRCQHGLMGIVLPVVCLCGPSAAGKTTFSLAMAKALRQRGRQPLLITCDDYYRQEVALIPALLSTPWPPSMTTLCVAISLRPVLASHKRCVTTTCARAPWGAGP